MGSELLIYDLREKLTTARLDQRSDAHIGSQVMLHVDSIYEYLSIRRQGRNLLLADLRSVRDTSRKPDTC